MFYIIWWWNCWTLFSLTWFHQLDSINLIRPTRFLKLDQHNLSTVTAAVTQAYKSKGCSIKNLTNLSYHNVVKFYLILKKLDIFENPFVLADEKCPRSSNSSKIWPRYGQNKIKYVFRRNWDSDNFASKCKQQLSWKWRWWGWWRCWWLWWSWLWCCWWCR